MKKLQISVGHAIKHIARMVLFLMAFSCFVVVEARAGDNDKQYRKESKKAAEQLNKEGWHVFGNAKSVKEAMDAHYKTLAEGEGTLTTIEGHGIAKDINVAVRKSQYNASALYASMQESKVEGTTNTKVSNKSGESSTSSDVEVSAQFQSSTDQTVKSLKPSVVFYRMMEDGKYEVKAFFIVKAL
jgi:hypothetical protein